MFDAFTPRPLLARLAGTPVPRVWCPPLTHYADDGSLDLMRMAAHWDHLAGHVRGFLVPGSTGDAWEMEDGEIAALLGAALDLATTRPVRLLLGALKPDAKTTLATIENMLGLLRQRTGEQDVLAALAASGVVGFTVCPPTGEGLPEPEMESALDQVLKSGLPIAIYQLPQVTHNEMTPALVGRLASRHPNLVFFKDSSGGDRVANEAGRLDGVFVTRGAEGGYAGWLRETGGPYHGWLLSTANCFPRELARIVTDLEAGRTLDATTLSDRLSGVVDRVFGLVAGLPDGNAFANANKAMDHFMAHGVNAPRVTPPRLHAGSRLSADIIEGTGAILAEAGLVPKRGYLES